jgi:hypothetical protein
LPLYRKASPIFLSAGSGKTLTVSRRKEKCGKTRPWSPD